MRFCRTRYRSSVAMPRFLFLGDGGISAKRLLHHAAWPGVEASGFGHAADRVWLVGEKAAWYACGDCLRREDSPAWTALMAGPRVPAADDGDFFSGAVLVLDAAHLLHAAGWEIRETAAAARARLLRAGERAGVALSVHLLIDNMDTLYGMRSLAALVPPERLGAPLGSFRSAAAETPSAFAGRMVDRAAAFAHSVADRHPALRAARPGGRAAFQAGDEIARLRKPLACFCAEAFAEGFAAPLPRLRSVFFGATGSGAAPLPSLLAAFPSFHPEAEPDPPDQPWFWTELLRRIIPAAVDSAEQEAGGRHRRRPRAAAWGGLLTLFLGALVVNGLMACAFWETRGVLLAARDGLVAPLSGDRAGALLAVAEEVGRRNSAWRLPRFGMEEAGALEIETRRLFQNAYYEIRAVPGVERAQEAALEAAASQQPERIGNTLALLIRLRRILTREWTAETADADRLLVAVTDASGLADADALRQLRAYLAWAAPQEWPAAVAGRFAEFERYIVETAMGGDPMRWLPAWVEHLPGLEPAQIAFSGAERRARVAAAWTGAGYAAAAALLGAVGEGAPGLEDWPARREACLAAYRRRAATAWLDAAGDLMRDLPERVTDDQARQLLRQALRGESPADHVLARMREHLSPMFPAESDDPDIVWLRLLDAGTRTPDAGVQRWREALAAAMVLSDSLARNLQAVRLAFREGDRPDFLPRTPEEERFGNPLAELLDAADVLDARLREKGGGGRGILWPGAMARYIRHLSVRLAALSLDALWRTRMASAAFPSGGADGKRDAVKRFLEDASGLWRMEKGQAVAAVWDGMAFPFNREFFAYCDEVMIRGGKPAGGRIRLPISLERVDVNAGARQLPETVELFWGTGDDREILIYRNFGVRGELIWTPGDEAVLGVRVVFPSRTCTALFRGAAAAGFLRRLAAGGGRLGAADFAENGAGLAALGVREIVLRASLDDAAGFVERLEAAYRPAPDSIIERDFCKQAGTPPIACL